MGFKIENISEVRNVNSSMDSARDALGTYVSQVKSSIEELATNIRGENVDVALNTFNEKISEFMTLVVDTEKQVNEFINKQLLEYENIETTTSDELAKVTSALDEITF